MTYGTVQMVEFTQFLRDLKVTEVNTTNRRGKPMPQSYTNNQDGGKENPTGSSSSPDK